VKAAECTIGAKMPDSFVLIIDGWSHRTEHYIAAFACYETDAGPYYPLMSLIPMVGEPDVHLNDEDHLETISQVLPFFGNYISGCKFLVNAPSTNGWLICLECHLLAVHVTASPSRFATTWDRSKTFRNHSAWRKMTASPFLRCYNRGAETARNTAAVRRSWC
jgi:hypothetical protein